jgi:transcriptional regulator with XRE-family HTH domain
MTGKESKSPAIVANKLNAKQQPPTDLDSKADLIRRLARSLAARIRFVESHVAKTIAFQVQSMRAKKGWTQEHLASRLGSNQNAVYRLENPYYGKQTLTTLRKVAAEFDVALIVRFAPFSELVDWVGGLSSESLTVPSFDEDFDRVRPAAGSEQSKIQQPREETEVQAEEAEIVAMLRAPLTQRLAKIPQEPTTSPHLPLTILDHLANFEESKHGTLIGLGR